VSPLRVRRERLSDDALVIVRGGMLSADELRIDAVRAFERFGEYAISVLAAPEPGDLDRLEQTALRRFNIVTLTTAGAIRRIGLDLVPTFRRPHYSVLLPALDADIARLMGCENEVRTNPHFEPGEAQT